MSTRDRVVGVLGGMGPAATLDFLAKLQAATPVRRDQDHLRVLVDINPKVPDRNAALAGGGPSPAPMLAAMARGLEVAGAEVVVMACNSAHAFADDVRAALGSARFVDIVEETAGVVRRDYPAAGRVGLLAAAACLDARLYQDAFAAVDVDVVVPEGELRSRFMTLLYRIKLGETGPDAKVEMRSIAEALVAQGAEVVVSGCTEVPLVLGAADLDAPLVDSTEALVAATLASARGG